MGTSAKVNLLPFVSELETDHLSLRATAGLNQGILSIDYELCGNLQQVLFPMGDGTPQRLDNLWERTCFEAFFTWARRGETFYWELNAAPGGSWNLYRLADYRSGVQIEQGVSCIKHEFKQVRADLVVCKIQVDLSSILPQDPSSTVELGLTAVIEKKDHSKTYWAVRHTGEAPDFHLRKSFVIALDL